MDDLYGERPRKVPPDFPEQPLDAVTVRRRLPLKVNYGICHAGGHP
jgi:hypothetical protein